MCAFQEKKVVGVRAQGSRLYASVYIGMGADHRIFLRYICK